MLHDEAINIHTGKQFYRTNYGYYSIQCERDQVVELYTREDTKSQYSSKKKLSV